MRRWIASCAGAAFASAALIAPVPSAHAQNVVLQANTDRPVVRENESFTYTIRAEGQLRAEPELGPLEREFDVLQRSSSSRIQFVNGQTSQVTEWEYQLMPKRSGAFTLPEVRVGNYFTNSVELQVLAAEAAGNAPADIFMELEAEPSVVYVQSQVLFTLRLFVGVSTGRATLTPPEITGGEAIVERLGEDNQYQTTRGGRNFIVRERRYAIFPQQAGALTIGPATFEAMVIPERGFSRVQRFRSSTLELTVHGAVPPPASAPDAVWLPALGLRLAESWDDGADLAAGVPRTRTVTIEADGVLETQLPEIAIAQQPSLRQYADQPELEREITPAGLRSQRTVRYAVIAQAPGELTLPGIEVPWWNVAEQRWEVARLAPRMLTVAPSGEAPTPTPANEPVEVAAPAPAPRAGDYWPIVSGVLAVGWLLTLASWWVVARRARPRASPTADSAGASSTPAPASQRQQLRALRAACAANDAPAARNALLKWAVAVFPAAPPRSLGALAAVVPRDVAAPILELEAQMYGGVAGKWDGRALSDTIEGLQAVAEQSPRRPKDDELLPLYR